MALWGPISSGFMPPRYNFKLFLYKFIMESKDNEKEKRLKAIKRLGELLEKTGATPEETIKIIREIRGKEENK